MVAFEHHRHWIVAGGIVVPAEIGWNQMWTHVHLNYFVRENLLEFELALGLELL